uniref:AB hydrolase-1 domain-containing protein n=1 Tax=Fagus sylvatica TaxID=28930 RepID=A0A2N9FYW6_FAGSY
MGNLCGCLAQKPVNKKKATKRLANANANAAALSSNSSNRWTRIRSSRKEKFDDALIQEQALAAATIILQQHNASLPFDRSASLRYPNSTGSKKNQLPRSSSSRARSLTDPLLQPHQLVNQDIKLDDLETNHFVLVHGGGFGAWCWYKTIALLEEGGFKVSAIDLTGSGIHTSDTNSITSLSQYVKPLTDFLEKLAGDEKVILVGHDFGGTCISYAMELSPSKISKAVFIAAAMLTNGQSTLDMFTKQDVALASVSMRPLPFAPVLEKLALTDMKYGSVRRFYIETPEDNAISSTLQASMINSSPPERVFRVKGADHSPFFSKPQALHKLLVEISKIPST